MSRMVTLENLRRDLETCMREFEEAPNRTMKSAVAEALNTAELVCEKLLEHLKGGASLQEMQYFASSIKGYYIPVDGNPMMSVESSVLLNKWEGILSTLTGAPIRGTEEDDDPKGELWRLDADD